MMSKELKDYYHKYKCPYCREEFKAKSGKDVFVDKKLILVKNQVKCPKCKNGLKNKA
jgi:Zn finger protein HypA/HybF involved in hydrogenase expression